MGTSNGQNQRGCFWQLLSCCGKEDDELCPSLLGGDKSTKTHEINQTSEIMEYRFQAQSEGTSEVPSEYHSETEIDEQEVHSNNTTSGSGSGGEKPKTNKEAISVDSPSHLGAKWRLVPSTHKQ